MATEIIKKALEDEMKRHWMVVALLLDTAAVEGILKALEQESNGEVITVEELRRKINDVI